MKIIIKRIIPLDKDKAIFIFVGDKITGQDMTNFMSMKDYEEEYMKDISKSKVKK